MVMLWRFLSKTHLESVTKMTTKVTSVVYEDMYMRFDSKNKKHVIYKLAKSSEIRKRT